MKSRISIVDLNNWLLQNLRSPRYRRIICNSFASGYGIHFAPKALLLIDGLVRGCDWYRLPQDVCRKLSNSSIPSFLSRNQPAVEAFKFAGGELPRCWRTGYALDVHHIFNSWTAFDSVREPQHFTQAAGLVALTRELHDFAHSDEIFDFYLRARAYQIHSYDPDGTISGLTPNKYGFVGKQKIEILCRLA